MNCEDKLAELKGAFENHLIAETEKWNFPSKVKESMKYALLSGGKRFRPLLLLCVYEAFSGDVSTAALDFALAIEAIHTYSLVHDDLPCMDDDDFRRGNPTVHKKFGEAVAVLTGDALLNFAYEKLFSITEKHTTKNVVKACKLLSLRSGASGLIAGQINDLNFENEAVNQTQLEYIFRHKTCDLIMAAVECGALLANAKLEDVNALCDFAYNFGYAFQLADDLLDGNANDGCSSLRLYKEEEIKQQIEAYTESALNALKKVTVNVGILEYFAKKAKNRTK